MNLSMIKGGDGGCKYVIFFFVLLVAKEIGYWLFVIGYWEKKKENAFQSKPSVLSVVFFSRLDTKKGKAYNVHLRLLRGKKFFALDICFIILYCFNVR